VEHPADVDEHPSMYVGVDGPGDHGVAHLLEEGGLQFMVVAVEENTTEILVGVGLLMDGSTAEVVGVRVKHQSATEVIGVGVKHQSLVKVSEGARLRVSRQSEELGCCCGASKTGSVL
jgi:hypothetical protein